MTVTTPNYFALQYPSFQPAMRNILSITNAFPAVITTTFDGSTAGVNQYQNGMIVRLRIPYSYGMQGADQFEGPVTVISTTSFSLPIDTTLFEPFAVPTGAPVNFGTPAVVVNVGETNDNLRWSQQNVLPYPLVDFSNPIE